MFVIVVVVAVVVVVVVVVVVLLMLRFSTSRIQVRFLQFLVSHQLLPCL
jgi:hypothetical protein